MTPRMADFLSSPRTRSSLLFRKLEGCWGPGRRAATRLCSAVEKALPVQGTVCWALRGSPALPRPADRPWAWQWSRALEGTCPDLLHQALPSGEGAASLGPLPQLLQARAASHHPLCPGPAAGAQEATPFCWGRNPCWRLAKGSRGLQGEDLLPPSLGFREAHGAWPAAGMGAGRLPQPSVGPRGQHAEAPLPRAGLVARVQTQKTWPGGPALSGAPGLGPAAACGSTSFFPLRFWCLSALPP